MLARSADCVPVDARCELGMQFGGSTRHAPMPRAWLSVRAPRRSPRGKLEPSCLAPGQRGPQVPDPAPERAPVQGLERESVQEREGQSEQESAPAAPRPVEAVSMQVEEGWRAAQRVPGEGWRHSAAGASRADRRTCRRRRSGCRDGRRACRAPFRRTDRRRRSDLPRRPTHPSGPGERPDASAKPCSRPRSRS